MQGAGGSVVYLHVGQCGNQVGDAFWRLADAQCASASPARAAAASSRWQRQLRGQFFHGAAATARCILVDTEPKVVRAVQRSLSAAHAHTEHAGRGNNWAMGYNFQQHRRNVVPSKTMAPTVAEQRRALRRGHDTMGLVGEPSDRRELVELVMESLRVEIEALDRYEGTMLMHSLGGGTGAGLGCRLLETMRDTYPRAYLTTLSVAPSRQSGDTPLQNYNALFTLQHLQAHADCVILKENDDLLRAATRWKTLRSKGSDAFGNRAPTGADSPDQQLQHARVSVHELNSLIASDVAGFVFPLVTSIQGSAKGVKAVDAFKMGRLVHDCCPMPTAKFVDMRTGGKHQSDRQTLLPDAKRGAQAIAPHMTFDDDDDVAFLCLASSEPREPIQRISRQMVVAQECEDRESPLLLLIADECSPSHEVKTLLQPGADTTCCDVALSREDTGRFPSWEAFDVARKAHCEKTHTMYVCRNTVKVEVANKRRRLQVPESWVYDRKVFVCTHGYKRVSRSNGLRPRQKARFTGCRARFTAAIANEIIDGKDVLCIKIVNQVIVRCPLKD
ncbi:hypothetical protein P43SY_005161 [Pythium insidiosum]|uniref:Tubulin/FtsZ GTPase domain-containing protein n=1 Tax=Pythium insidiosum TaxID=114742 RepID=A0AAD5LJH2_PYTIN|nr:hypothetical protein P43SY_005161 [Pythium insidiosum]